MKRLLLSRLLQSRKPKSKKPQSPLSQLKQFLKARLLHQSPMPRSRLLQRMTSTKTMRRSLPRMIRPRKKLQLPLLKMSRWPKRPQVMMSKSSKMLQGNQPNLMTSNQQTSPQQRLRKPWKPHQQRKLLKSIVSQRIMKLWKLQW